MAADAHANANLAVDEVTQNLLNDVHWVNGRPNPFNIVLLYANLTYRQSTDETTGERRFETKVCGESCVGPETVCATTVAHVVWDARDAAVASRVCRLWHRMYRDHRAEAYDPLRCMDRIWYDWRDKVVRRILGMKEIGTTTFTLLRDRRLVVVETGLQLLPAYDPTTEAGVVIGAEHLQWTGKKPKIFLRWSEGRVYILPENGTPDTDEDSRVGAVQMFFETRCGQGLTKKNQVRLLGHTADDVENEVDDEDDDDEDDDEGDDDEDDEDDGDDEDDEDNEDDESGEEDLVEEDDDEDEEDAENHDEMQADNMIYALFAGSEDDSAFGPQEDLSAQMEVVGDVQVVEDEEDAWTRRTRARP